MNKKKAVEKESAIQAVVIADIFGNEFAPITNDIPHALLPVINTPLIDYTLEFLSLGGIEETFLFCSSHAEVIKEHINKSLQIGLDWTLTMKVNVIVSESCRSFGDCLRDLDAKGVLRGDFVLLEPGAISNVPLLPLLKKHNSISKQDKGAAMTVIFQETGLGHISMCPSEELLIAAISQNRILFHKKVGKDRKKKIEFPLEIFLDNPLVSIIHNLRDTGIAICSPSVLPLYSDNFDFQSKDDFVRGLLMNEEILGSTVYCHILKGSHFGGAITSWRMYQAISRELKDKWIYPLIASNKKNKLLKKCLVVGKDTKIVDYANLRRSVVGENVSIGKNVILEDSFIFNNTTIEDNVVITHSIIGPKCTIKSKSKITNGTVLGTGCVIEKNTSVENILIQSKEPESNYLEKEDKLSNSAFRRRLSRTEEESDSEENKENSSYYFYTNQVLAENPTDWCGFSDSSDDDIDSDNVSQNFSPPPDDTKLFFNEVIDSLTRGFEDNLVCDNLILEINSSRYAYNVTVKEVNFNVIKALLTMSLRQKNKMEGPQYFTWFSRLLAYFTPVLKNYLRNQSAMTDCLEAIKDVATFQFPASQFNSKWTTFVLQYFYNKDYVSEDAILDWFSALDKSNEFHLQVKPFTDWLQQAEEASSEEETSEEEN